MIHVVKGSTYIPSVDETLSTLRMHNQMMPQFADFDKVMMNISYLQFRIKDISKALFDIIGTPTKVDASGNMKYWLSRHADCSGFEQTKEGISLDKNSIAAAFESGTLNEDQKIVLQAYQKYSVLTRMRATLVGLLQNPISDAPSVDGHRMLILRPSWEAQNTGRVAMQRPAIQNFQHELQEIITVPKGYIKCHTDSGQIEPRIIYSTFIPDAQIQSLINLYDDAYFGVLHYVQMPESDIISKRMNFEKMEITDAMREGRKKIKTHQNAVMYGSKSNPSGDPVKAAMIKRIGEHPLRLAKLEELQNDINRGVTRFPTALGTMIDISKSAKLEEGNMHSGTRGEQLLKLAINNPIQGTAADLMRVSVYEANRLMMNKAKKSYIINYVHDAGMFAIHEDDYDKVADELGDIVSYKVDGWLPISAEPEFGRDGGKGGLIEDIY